MAGSHLNIRATPRTSIELKRSWMDRPRLRGRTGLDGNAGKLARRRKTAPDHGQVEGKRETVAPILRWRVGKIHTCGRRQRLATLAVEPAGGLARAMWNATHRPAVRVQERQERQVVARGFGVNEAARSAVEPPEYTSRFRTSGKLDLLG